MDKTTRITILGTGNAMCVNCYNTCFYLHTPMGGMLVDGGGGNGILQQLMKAKIPFESIKHMFVTHSHTDHILGAIWMMRKISPMIFKGKHKGPFTIYCNDVVRHALYTMGELMKLKAEGKIRCIGLSNFSKAQIIEAEQYGEVDVLQPCWSLLWRYQDNDSLAYAEEKGIGVIPYSPLAQGILTGKFTKDYVFPAGDGRNRASLFQQPYFSQAIDFVDSLRPFAEKYGVTLAQLSLRMCMQQSFITSPIVGAKRPDQVEDNVKAIDFEISADDFATIDQMSKDFAYALPAFNSFFRM